MNKTFDTSPATNKWQHGNGTAALIVVYGWPSLDSKLQDFLRHNEIMFDKEKSSERWFKKYTNYAFNVPKRSTKEFFDVFRTYFKLFGVTVEVVEYKNSAYEVHFIRVTRARL